jgi:hypothetical protein
MAQQYGTFLTPAGEAAFAQAVATGKDVVISFAGIGDGNGSEYMPVDGQTDLKNQVYECPVNSVYIDTSNPNWVDVEIYIPETVGGWTIREVSIKDANHVPLAVGTYPSSYKPVLAAGSAVGVYIKFILQVVNASAVSIVIDPSIVLATRQYVDSAIAAHAALTNVHGATVAATANRIIIRDANGRAQIAAPAAAADIARLADITAGTRIIATAAVNFYVRTDGNDANNGLANTPAGAFKTIMAATWNLLKYDFRNNGVTINIAAGTYNEHVLVGPVLLSSAFGGLTYAGAGVGQTIVNGPTSPGNLQGSAAVTGWIQHQWTGCTFKVVDANAAIVNADDNVLILTNCEFLATAAGQIGVVTLLTASCNLLGMKITGAFNYVLSGQCNLGASTWTVSGSVSTAFFYINAPVYGGSSQVVTFTGSMTGPKYLVTYNGVLTLAGTVLPGSTAGTTSTGGQVIP